MAKRVFQLADGKLLIVGTVLTLPLAGLTRTHYDFGVARLTSNGDLDLSLSPYGPLPGRFLKDLGSYSNDIVMDALLQVNDGNLVVAGNQLPNGVIARYDIQSDSQSIPADLSIEQIIPQTLSS